MLRPRVVSLLSEMEALGTRPNPQIEREAHTHGELQSEELCLLASGLGQGGAFSAFPAPPYYFSQLHLLLFIIVIECVSVYGFVQVL